MSVVRTVAGREFRSFVDQPTAYVLAVAFLVLSLFLTFRSMYATGGATLRPLFDLLPLLLAVFVPAVTMRSVAEERRGRTLDWLIAQPIDEVRLLLGKIGGNVAFVLLAVAGTLPTALGVALVSDADPGIMVAQYVGAALLTLQLVAVGVWASTITRNQITAFIVAASLSLALFLIGLPVVQIGLPPAVAGVLARLSVLGHFENVARGVVDLRDVLYFVSTAGLFFVLALAALARHRLAPGGPESRRLAVGTGLVAVIVVALNLLGSHVPGRLDLTRDRLFTLAEGTREMLGGLDDMVQVTLYASSELPPEVQLQLRDVRDLLRDFERHAGGALVVRDVDPDEDEEAAEAAASAGVLPIEFNVLRDDEFQVRRGYYGMTVGYADELEVFPYIERTDDLEFRLASTLAAMTDEERPRLVFATGAGARSHTAMPGLRESLAERYEFGTWALDADTLRPLSPDTVAVVVLAGPTALLDSAAVEHVRRFADGGGAVLALVEGVEVDPRSLQPRPVRTGLESLLGERGVGVAGDLVADLASSERVSLGRRGLFNVVAPYPLWPVAVPAGDHPTTRGLGRLSLGWSTALEVRDSASVTPLWSTTDAAALRPPSLPIFPDQSWDIPDDQLAPRVTAVAVDPAAAAEAEEPSTGASARGRMVVVADADFASGQFLQGNPQNLAFLANAVDWLAQDESLIRIRAKDRTPPALVFTSDLSRDLLKWGNLAGVPILFALVGVVRVTGRRRRAETRWKEVVA